MSEYEFRWLIEEVTYPVWMQRTLDGDDWASTDAWSVHISSMTGRWWVSKRRIMNDKVFGISYWEWA